jgi:hypothetical protein
MLCELPARDLKNDCPKCPLAELRRSFKSEVESEIERRYGKLADFSGWPFEKLRDLFVMVSSLLDQNENRINPKWDMVTAGLARIIRSETSKAEYVRAWNQLQNSK